MLERWFSPASEPTTKHEKAAPKSPDLPPAKKPRLPTNLDLTKVDLNDAPGTASPPSPLNPVRSRPAEVNTAVEQAVVTAAEMLELYADCLGFEASET